MKRKLFALVAVGAFATWFGCAGDDGPMGPPGPAGPPGPSTILVFGDIDGELNPPLVRSFGPSSTVDSIVTVTNSTGNYSISVFGTFPASPGTVVTSPASASSGQAPGPTTLVTGEVSSWTSSMIMLQVDIVRSNDGTVRDDDFSFVIFGE